MFCLCAYNFYNFIIDVAMQNTLLDSYRIAQNFGGKKLLAVHRQSAKVLSAKKLSGLVNSNIEWALPVPTAKVFSANIL